VSRVKDPNRSYHDRIAARYDDIYGKDPYWDYYFEVSWQDLKKSLPQDLGKPVLDAGCGSGRYGIKLLKSGFRTVFSDLSAKMVDVAARKAAEAAPGRSYETAVADIVDLAPFADGQFSLVIAQGDPLSFASDTRAALRSIFRVLMPGGRAVLSVDSRFGGIDPFLQRKDLDGLEAFLDSGEGEWLAHRKDERFPFHAFTAEELRRECERAGFAVRHLIGKTLFDLRGGHPWLEDSAQRRRLLRLEERHGASAAALGRAHHLQVSVERPKG
jgi:SAM-dependent methyltransferase